MLRSRLVVTPFVVLAALTTHAQDLPLFRAGTTLVEFTLVAFDAEGRPVIDLTKEEIVVMEDDRTREVAFFRFEGETPAITGARLPLPDGYATNRPAPDRNAVAIVLDLLNVPAHYREKYGQTEVRGLILETLRTLPPNTYAGLFRFAETQPIVALEPFTANVGLLREKVRTLDLALRLEENTASVSLSGASRKADGGASLAAMAQSEARGNNGVNRVIYEMRLSRSLAALQTLGSHLGGIPGRKSLVWITVPPPLMYGDVNYEPRIREVAQRLASRDIALYPVHAAGLPPERRDDNLEVSTFSVLANVTGGRMVKDNNDLLMGLSLAANDQRGTYVVGYYTEDEPRDRWRPVRVAIKRQGVSTRYREGYIAARYAQARMWEEKDWNALAAQQLDSTEIRLNGSADVTRSQLLLALQVAARDLYFHNESGQLVADLEIAIVELSPRGSTNVRVQPMEVSIPVQGTAQRPEIIALKTTWPVAAGTTAVRAVVRDRFTGKYGTLQLMLNRTAP